MHQKIMWCYNKTMFEVLDAFFPDDITNFILGFISGYHLSDAAYSRRVFHAGRTDVFGLPVPKEVFRKAVWFRRYYNPHMSEGAKLHAYCHVDLPRNRLRFILARSYSKFQVLVECPCPVHVEYTHWFLHWMGAAIRKVESHDIKDQMRSGWGLSVPFAILFFSSQFDDDHAIARTTVRLRADHPDLPWRTAAEIVYFCNSTGKTYPFNRELHDSFNRFIPRIQ